VPSRIHSVGRDTISLIKLLIFFLEVSILEVSYFISFTMYEICKDFSYGINIQNIYSFFLLFYILYFDFSTGAREKGLGY